MWPMGKCSMGTFTLTKPFSITTLQRVIADFIAGDWCKVVPMQSARLAWSALHKSEIVIGTCLGHRLCWKKPQEKKSRPAAPDPPDPPACIGVIGSVRSAMKQNKIDAFMNNIDTRQMLPAYTR